MIDKRIFELDKSKNLTEYSIIYREITKNGKKIIITSHTATALVNLNLREFPQKNSKVLTIIGKNSQVLINSYPPEDYYWFNITYSNITGWANGNYLVHLNEKKEYIKGFSLFLDYLFPRKTLWRNIFGLVLDLFISIITTVIVYKIRNDTLDYITSLTPIIWFLLRTGLLYQLNPFYQIGGFALATAIYLTTMGILAKKFIYTFL